MTQKKKSYEEIKSKYLSDVLDSQIIRFGKTQYKMSDKEEKNDD